MARIEYTDVEGKVHRVVIPRGGEGVVIGRNASCDVVLNSKSVGRNHGRITREGGSYVFRDLGSVNGSFVNGGKVTGAVVLADGAKVRCGDSIMDFVFDAADGRKAPPSKSKATMPVPAPPETIDVSRLQKENKALRAELKSLSTRVASSDSDTDEVEALKKKLADSSAASGEAEDEARHLRGLMADGEHRVKDAEARAATANSSLESVHAKYLDMREQVQHTQSLLDEARASLSDSESELSDLREQWASLSAQAEAARNRGGQAAEEVSDLKVKVTEKDREMERLQRELDIRDYDLKALREENERLQDYCETDSGRQEALERKVKNLEAVIEENRNYIAELRRTNEEKDRQVREVRLGVGIADLEQEKQRLLDDFHKKSREVDDLQADLSARGAELEGVTSEKDELQARVKKLEKAGRTRRADTEDISDHPEYLAKVREVDRLIDTEATLTAELGTLRDEREMFSEEARARLEADLNASQEKSQVLADRLEKIRGEAAKDAGASKKKKARKKKKT